MPTSSEILPLFSSPVYCAVDDTMPDILDKIENLEYHNFTGQYRGGVSSVEQNILKEIPEMAEFLKPHISEYVHGVQGVEDKYIIDVPCSWVNIHQHMDATHEHNHRHSMWSGIVYLKTHPNCGDLVFSHYKYATIDPDRAHYNIYNSPRWTVTPQDGMVLIFPSDLVHSVKPNQDTLRRYSLAFNIMLRGDFGNPTSLLSL